MSACKVKLQFSKTITFFAEAVLTQEEYDILLKANNSDSIHPVVGDMDTQPYYILERYESYDSASDPYEYTNFIMTKM